MLGVYIVSSNKRVCTLLFPQKVSPEEPFRSKVLMGTVVVVDSTLSVKPEYCEIVITHNIMVLVEESLQPCETKLSHFNP